MKKKGFNAPFIVDKFIASIIIATVLIFVAIVLLGSKITPSVQIELDSEAKAQLEKTTHNWDKIDMADGKVEAQFTIESTGNHPLKLYDVKTSCMCTEAQLISDNQTSPTFDMHSKSNYVLELAKGKSAQLKVVFDPEYHGPSGVGPITRQVEVSTNDQDNSKLTFLLTATVTR